MASELAAAFLTLAPKLESGFGSKVKDELEDEIDGKSLGDSVGGSFGKQLSGSTKKAFTAGTVALGNIMSNVALKAANFAGDAFADAFENIMNYEQLQGGVEKIFDQANTAQIFEDAQNAFKTLNMSANEYLESINQVGASFAQTMGDQKGYDTAKTGMQAIADYASGTGRNINELNDKFAMITRATSSYQSIADQFSGILPATSKDFLEQAQAAGILSDSYTQLTEVPVAEYQEAVSLMLQKGVEDMGLAGNTAAESADTISGSIAMLKSSWDNLLTSLGDESGTIDVDKAVADLKTSLEAVGKNVLPVLERIGEELAQALPPLIESGLQEAISTADEWVPKFADIGGNIMLAIASGIANGIAPFMDELNAGVEDGLNAVGTGISDFASGVGDAMSELLSGAQHDLGAMGDAFGEARDAIGTALSGAVTNVTTGARGIMDGISRGISSIPGRVKGVFERVKSAISEPIDKAKTLVSGAIDHIKGLFPLSIGKIFSNIQLPRITVDPGSPPYGLGGKGHLPSFDVGWAARGGIVDGATLIGAGEAGPEAIIPLQGQFMRPFAHAIAEELGGGGITINLNYDASDDANDMLRDITSGIRQLRAAGAI